VRLRRQIFIASIILSFMASNMFSASAFSSEELCNPLVLDVIMGEPITMDTLIEDLSSVRIVYLGELHTIKRHHQVQKDIIRALYDKHPKIALGLEMFSENQQQEVDNWMRGKGGIDDLVKALGKDHWTNLIDYEPILTTVRKLGIPVIALNAPDSLVKKLAKHGVEPLRGTDKDLISLGLDAINPIYDRILRLRLKVHRAFQEKSLDRIVAAQYLRDLTMAGNIEKFFSSSQGNDFLMVVIAGSGHLSYGLGIPEIVSRRLGLAYRIMLPSESGELELSEDELRQSVPLNITHKDLRFINSPIADYLHLIPLKESSRQITSQ
jgi:uncharacterized iron-regulated protein